MSAKTAADLCPPIPLSPPGKALLQPTLTPRAFLDALVAKGLHPDALLFMAHAMPKREAVWWGCLCARVGYGTPPAVPGKILESAEKWVVSQTDEQRRATFALAEAAGFDNPASLLGMAVFFSGDSLAPPKLQAVPPQPHLAGNAVGNAAQLAAFLQGAGKANELYPKFMALGLDVAAGKNRWKG